MPIPRGDWKSIAADRLNQMGLGNNARALYGIKEPQRPPDEMLSHQLREEGKRRAARPRPRPKSTLARLRAWFNL